MDIFKYLADLRAAGWPFKNGKPDAFEFIPWAICKAREFQACADLLEHELRDHWQMKRYRPERTQHLHVLLANLLVAEDVRPGKGVKIRGRADAYAGASTYRPPFLSAKVLPKVANGLAALGYVEKLEGIKDLQAGDGFVSQVRPTDKLRELWHAFGVRARFVELAPEAPLVALRGPKNGKGNAPLIEPIRSERLRAIEDGVRQINDFVAQHDIRLNGETESRTAMACRLHRVFNDERADNQTLSRGGRFYGAFWHELPKDDRSRIVIDGQQTVELDYGSFHVRMIYHLNGLPCEGDPYDVEAVTGLIDERDRSSQRSFVKELTNTLINATARQCAALGQMSGQAIEARYGVRLNGESPLKAVLDAIKARHELIKDGLASGIGLDLQGFDAEICDQIHLTMIAKGIPVLSVHDSFIVPAVHGAELRAAMVACYRSVLGCDFDPVIKPAGKTETLIADGPDEVWVSPTTWNALEWAGEPEIEFTYDERDAALDWVEFGMKKIR